MTVLEKLQEADGKRIQRRVLCKECNMNDRAVRREIEELRKHGFFIGNSQDGSGYFLLNPNDLSALQEQYRQMRKRALCILSQTTPLRRRIRELEKEKEDAII